MGGNTDRKITATSDSLAGMLSDRQAHDKRHYDAYHSGLA